MTLLLKRKLNQEPYSNAVEKHVIFSLIKKTNARQYENVRASSMNSHYVFVIALWITT